MGLLSPLCCLRSALVSSLREERDLPLVSSGKSQTSLLSRGLKVYATTGAGVVKCVYLSCVLSCGSLF